MNDQLELKNMSFEGLQEVRYAVLQHNPLNGRFQYGTPKILGCTISNELSPQGSETKVYTTCGVDSYTVNQGYSGTISFSKLVSDFEKEILNFEETPEGGLIEHSNRETKPFALIFEQNGKQGRKRTILYNCKIERPNIGGSVSEDSPSIANQTANLIVTPMKVELGDNEVSRIETLVKYVLEEDKTNPLNEKIFDSLFDEVFIPGYTEIETNPNPDPESEDDSY